MLKILQVRLQQYVNRELLDLQVDLEKTEEAEIKLPHSLDHGENEGLLEKHLLPFH